jgi:hypothetical protein
VALARGGMALARWRCRARGMALARGGMALARGGMALARGRDGTGPLALQGARGGGGTAGVAEPRWRQGAQVRIQSSRGSADQLPLRECCVNAA